MEKQLTKSRIVILVGVLVALVSVSTAAATHVFSDVEDDRFFTVPVTWASENGITTGTSPTTFHPDRNVTRGESVTFLQRYDDNIVQPALADRYTKAEVDAEVDAAVDAAVDVAVGEVSDQLGGMNFLPIDVAIDAGEDVDLTTLDGVTINVSCVDEGAGSVSLSVDVSSSISGWFAPWSSGTVLDDVTAANWITTGVAATETSTYQIDGFSARTANGGYIAIDGETSQWLLLSSVDDADCIYMGMLQWFPPAVG